MFCIKNSFCFFYIYSYNSEICVEPSLKSLCISTTATPKIFVGTIDVGSQSWLSIRHKDFDVGVVTEGIVSGDDDDEEFSGTVCCCWWWCVIVCIPLLIIKGFYKERKYDIVDVHSIISCKRLVKDAAKSNEKCTEQMLFYPRQYNRNMNSQFAKCWSHFALSLIK